MVATALPSELRLTHLKQLETEAIHIISGTLVLGAETTVEAGTSNTLPLSAIRSSGGALIHVQRSDGVIVTTPTPGGFGRC